MSRCVLVVLVTLGLVAGCASPNVRPARTSIGSTPAVVMGANLRIVTERGRPMPGRSQPLPTLCVDPNPDVVVLLDRSTQATLNVAAATGLSGQQDLTVQSKETAAALSRDKGVQALRDGLYAACQSYANGSLGQLAYSLILSQYGSLLVALVGNGGDKPGLHRSSNDTALAGLMVACISEYDPTRIGALQADRLAATNQLLSQEFCQRLLNDIASGRALSHAALEMPNAPNRLAMATMPGGPSGDARTAGGSFGSAEVPGADGRERRMAAGAADPRRLDQRHPTRT